MTTRSFDDFERLAISPSSVTPAGNYTVPKTWGVYRIPAHDGGLGMTYRVGNHPIRHQELVSEFGSATLVLLFTQRALAVELRGALNGGLTHKGVAVKRVDAGHAGKGS